MDDNTQLTQDLQQIDALEAEYRTWRVAVIRLGRGIDEVERRLCGWNQDAPARPADLTSRLSEVREQHDRLEAKLDRIRAQLDEAYARLEETSSSLSR